MKKETDTIRKQLDLLLAEIGAKTNAIALMEKALAAEIERVTDEFKPSILSSKEDLKLIEEELFGLAKINKAALFSDTDRVDFKNGAILRQVLRPVKRIKGMVARLKQLGEIAALKVVETVNWDELEKWPDDRLKAAGTGRVSKELFEYEIARRPVKG